MSGQVTKISWSMSVVYKSQREGLSHPLLTAFHSSPNDTLKTQKELLCILSVLLLHRSLMGSIAAAGNVSARLQLGILLA